MEDKIPIYDGGEAFWRENAANYGIDEALTICANYVGMQAKADISDTERQFCREIFDAAMTATAGRIDVDRVVYPYDFATAERRSEAPHYRRSLVENLACAKAIDDAISGCRYKPNYYHLDMAAMKVILNYGFDRVMRVLARNLQQREHDGRYSPGNKRWAADVPMSTGEAFERVYTHAHPTLLEDFTIYARQFYDELGAERLREVDPPEFSRECPEIKKEEPSIFEAIERDRAAQKPPQKPTFARQADDMEL